MLVLEGKEGQDKSDALEKGDKMNNIENNLELFYFIFSSRKSLNIRNIF